MSQLITIPLGLPDLRIINQWIERDLILVEVEKAGIDRCVSVKPCTHGIIDYNLIK